MTDTTTAKEGDGGELPGYGSCVHCGEPTDIDTAVESAGLRFCCTGCSAVYEILNSLGLDDYYKIRAAQNITGTTPARTPPPVRIIPTSIRRASQIYIRQKKSRSP